MRHKIKGKKLSRKKGHRNHMIRNLVASLVLYERIITTESKAKEIKGITEKLINIGKRGDLTAHRILLKFFFKKEPVMKIMEDLAKQFKDRSSGMTRVVKIGKRLGDNAQMATIELLVEHKEHKGKKEAVKAQKEVKRTRKKHEKEKTGEEERPERRKGFFGRLAGRGGSNIKPVQGKDGKTSERTTYK